MTKPEQHHVAQVLINSANELNAETRDYYFNELLPRFGNDVTKLCTGGANKYLHVYFYRIVAKLYIS